MDIVEWWPRLPESSRERLIAHNGEPVPDDIADEIRRLSGGIPAGAWWVAEEGPSGLLLSDGAVDWIEEVANGEGPTEPW